MSATPSLISAMSAHSCVNVYLFIYGDVQNRYTDTPEMPIGDPEVDFFFIRLF
jgi:hypothetical protein